MTAGVEGLPTAARDHLAAVLAPAVDDVFASRGYPLTDGDAQFIARYLADKVLRNWKPEEEA